MDTSFIKGVISPLVTPTDASKCVNEPVQRVIVDQVIKGGIHGILALGSNGDYYGLNPEEQERCGQIIIDQVAGRVPVYFCISGISTNECVKWAKKAEELNADAISVMPPLLLSHDDETLYQHFKSVAEATSLPVLIYNKPELNCCGVKSTLLERLVDIPNIVGIKENGCDMSLTAEFIRCAHDKVEDFKVIAGCDILILSTLVYGGVGTVSFSANIVPELVVEIYDKYMADDITGAVDAQFRLARMPKVKNQSTCPVISEEDIQPLGFDMGGLSKHNSRRNLMG